MRIHITLLGDRKTKVRNLSLQILAFAAFFLCATLPTSATAQDITTDLIGYWNFDETTGTVATDSSGSGLNGTLSGTTFDTGSEAGRFGNALRFDGVDDVVNLGSTIGISGDFTICAWVRPEANTTGYIFGKTNTGSGNPGPFFRGFSSGDNWLMSFGGGFDINVNAVEQNVWQHLCAVYKPTPGTSTFYKNATVLGTRTDLPAYDITNTIDATIGNNYSNSRDFDGLIDDVRIYNRALTEDDVALLYTSLPGGLPPCDTNYEAVMLYNADEKVMQYCNGTEWISVGSSLNDAVLGCPNIGDTCNDGTIYAGLSPDGNKPMYAAPADAPSGMSWDDGTSNWLDTAMVNCTGSETSCSSGKANTDLLATLGTTPSPAPYLAARYCYNLEAQTHDDWYLPARDELNVLYENLVDQDGDDTPGGPLGSTFGFNTSGAVPGGWYWSSTEDSSQTAKNQKFSDGYQGSNSDKDRDFSVRCVRKTNTGASSACTAPDADPGTMLYNRDEGVLQYCNGSNWINMGPKTAAGGMDDASALSPPAPTSGLVGHWPMDETSGTTLSNAAGGSNGTMSGGLDASTNSVPGSIGTALDFDGVDDWVSFSSDPSVNLIDLTISMWIKPDTTTSAQYGISLIENRADAGNTSNYEIKIDGSLDGTANDGNIELSYYSGGWHTILGSITPQVGQWQHITVTIDSVSNTYAFYLNGAQTVTGSTPADLDNSHANLSMSLGRSDDAADNDYYDGQMDDVRIYSRALGEDEVAQLYKSSSLIGHWKFDETSGTVAADSSGRGLDGTLIGTDFATGSESGRVGNALRFDGTDDMVNLGNTLGLENDFTICIWAKPESFTTGYIFGNYDIDTNYGPYFRAITDTNPGDSWTMGIRNSTYRRAVGSIEQNVWQHVCAVYSPSPGTSTLYKNAIALETATNFPAHVPHSKDATIGNRYDNSRRFKGLLDDVRVYNRALSADEVGKIYLTTGGDKMNADCAGLGDAHYNDPSTGHCYYRVDTPADFTTALANCQTNDAYLAEITSAEENDAIFNNLGGPGGDLIAAFFGASDQAVEGQWRWVSGGPKNGELFFTGDQNTGSAVDGMYANRFGQGLEPNNGATENCGAFSNIISSGWNDDLCGDPEVYICEKSANIGGTCSNPYAEAGVMFYNDDENIMQYCNGTDWVGITDTLPGTIPVVDTTDPVWTTAAGTVATIEPSAALSTTVTATDDSGSVTYSKTGGDAWISVNSSTGALTGTAPATEATYSITVTATDPSGNTAVRIFDVVVASAVDTTDPVWTTAAGTVDTIEPGTALSTTVVATDNSGSVTYSKTGGDAWISVNASTGALTGTAPAGEATYSITVTATDPSGNTAARSFDIVVEPCGSATTLGTTCGDGSVFVGLSPQDEAKVYMTSVAHEVSHTFDSDSCYNCGDGTIATSTKDGRVNTAALLAFNPTGFDAAAYCDGLTNVHGHSDWYLPAGSAAGSELYLFWTMVDTEGIVDGIGSTSDHYVSSTESSTSKVYTRRFDSLMGGNLMKGTTYKVRCVRRAPPPPDVTDPVWVTAGGTIATFNTDADYYTIVTATDDRDAVIYSKASGDAWLSVDSSTGEITGTTPSTAGTYSITVTAADPYGNAVDRTFSIVVQDPASCDTIGQQCPDDTFYIGLSPEDGTKVYMTTLLHEVSRRFDNPPCYSCGDGTIATSITDGRANTAALLAFNASGFSAAAYCDGLTAHGHSDWYLPASDGYGGAGNDELYLFWTMVQAQGAVDGIGGANDDYYWSSTESSTGTASVQRLTDGYLNGLSKQNTQSVRCVRR